MPDQRDGAQRPKPFAPPVAPFRGPATAARPTLTPLSPPVGNRPPAPVVARRSTRVAEQPAAPATVTSPVRVAAPEHPTAPAMSAPQPAPQAAPASAATGDAHLYGHDPFASPQPAVATPPFLRAAREVPGEDARPEETAHALAGLPFIDPAGAEHKGEAPSERKRTPGKLHRVGFDPAAVLESIAGRVRSGAIAPGALAPTSSDAAVLAAVLAALLREDGR